MKNIYLIIVLSFNPTTAICSELATYTQEQWQKFNYTSPLSTQQYRSHKNGIFAEHSGTGTFDGGDDGIHWPNHNYVLQQVNIQPVNFSDIPAQRKIIFIKKNEKNEGIIFEREESDGSMYSNALYFPRKMITTDALALIKTALSTMANNTSTIKPPYLSFEVTDGNNKQILVLNPLIPIQKSTTYQDNRCYINIGLLTRFKRHMSDLLHTHLCTIVFENSPDNTTTKALLQEKSKLMYYAKLTGIGIIFLLLVAQKALPY